LFALFLLIFSFGDLKRLLPGDFPIIRVLVTGEIILKSLENSVSKYPALEGRFPMVKIIK
jgi:hypothetical protein